MAAPSRYITSLCFCTAAFGRVYTLLAKLLAADLHQFAPDHLFVILTDRPEVFQDNPNVLAVKHWCRGVLPYHERRFSIQYALSFAASVMYLDADVRICAPVPNDPDFRPGLTARSCGDMKKHLQEQFDKPSLSATLQQKKIVTEQMARRVGVDLYSPSVKFINEFLFVVTADEGRELEFLRLWGELSIYADTLGLHKHPTYAMALAAVKSDFPIHHSEMEGLDFFDDRIEKIRISKGQSTPEAKVKYFREQSDIERQRRTFPQRVSQLALRKISLLYNLTRVQLISAVFPSVLVKYPILDSEQYGDRPPL